MNTEMSPHKVEAADKGKGGGLNEEQQREWELNVMKSRLGELGRLGEEGLPNVEKLIKNIDIFAKGEGENLEKTVHEIKKQYSDFINNNIFQNLEKILTDNLLRQKNPIPFDVGRMEGLFDYLGERVGIYEGECEGDPTKEAWAKRLKSDVVWANGFFRVLEGMCGSADKFFDWKLMMGTVRERNREDPTSDFYFEAFFKNLPGLEIGNEERRFLLGEAKKGLRERATKFQDDNLFWRFAVAGVHQLDRYKNPPEKFSRLPVKVTDIQRRFIEKVFAIRKTGKDPFIKLDNGEIVPREMLNWYAMKDTGENKNRYLEIMTVLLSNDILDQLNKLEPALNADGTPQGNITAVYESVDGLAAGVLQQCEGKYENRYALRSNLARIGTSVLDSAQNLERYTPSEYRLAKVIAKSGVPLDYGHFTAGYLGWGWSYDDKKNENEEIIGNVRERVGGSTVVATDITTAVFLLDYDAGSTRKNWPKGLFPPMDHDFRKQIESNSPDWVLKRTNFEEVLNNDTKLKSEWDALWKDEEGKKGFKWDPAVKQALKNELSWMWTTPYPKEKNSEDKLHIPLFVPPVLGLPFFDTISLVGEGKAKKKYKLNTKTGKKEFMEQDKTVMQYFCDGGKPSELRWDKMGSQAYYRWLITMGQTYRIINVIADSPLTDEGAAGFRDAFFKTVDNLPEAFKRTDLGMRDDRYPFTIYTIGIVPFMIAMHEAQMNSVIGAPRDAITCLTDFGIKMAKWAKVFEYDLPAERENFSNYGKGMARILRFYSAIIDRLSDVSRKTDEALVDNEYKKVKPKDARNISVSADMPTSKEKR